MELMERVLSEGKQVIVLIPEIALTYQNVERFCARFGTRVTVVNSRMTPSERADQMERAARGGQYYDRSAFRTLCTVSGSGADRN